VLIDADATDPLAAANPLAAAQPAIDQALKRDLIGPLASLNPKPGADRLAPRLRDAPGVPAAAAFGAALHVSGPEREPLLAAIEPLRTEGIDWKEAPPTLEDVFIHLMGKAHDNAPGA
jgi:ABC-2 type transport system ATP-binding protein